MPRARARSSALAVALAASIVQAAATAPRYPVRVVSDIDYLAQAEYADHRDRLDLYLPEGAARTPVIVSLHGGGLTQGDKARETHIGQRFAAAGLATAIVNYRLSPGVSHPAHVQDAAAAIAWVKAHIRDYGGDPGKVFVIGHSAGAYLAALLATDPRYLSAAGLSLRDIRGAVPVSGFFWVERVAPDRPKSVWGTDERTWRDASPAHHLRPDAPPILLLYADGDDEWRRKQNEEMAEALRHAGHGQVQIRRIANRDHAGIWQRMAGEDEGSTAILDFVRHVLGPGGKQPQ